MRNQKGFGLTEEIIIGAVFVVAIVVAWYFVWHKKTDVPPYYLPSVQVLPSNILPQISPTTSTISDKTCKRAGCSGQLCVDADDPGGVTTCEWREEYACYQKAECARQPNGQCGFTPTNELSTCLANAKK